MAVITIRLADAHSFEKAQAVALELTKGINENDHANTVACNVKTSVR